MSVWDLESRRSYVDLKLESYTLLRKTNQIYTGLASGEQGPWQRELGSCASLDLPLEVTTTLSCLLPTPNLSFQGPSHHPVALCPLFSLHQARSPAVGTIGLLSPKLNQD